MKSPSEPANSEAGTGEITEGPGAALCAARESLGITCREVAEALNLPLRVVEAIEVNDYEKLPVAVFTRGYIRAYAKLLELDADPIVARYTVNDSDETTRDDASLRSIGDVIRRYPEWVLGGGAIIVIVLVGIVLYVLWPLSDLVQSDGGLPIDQSTSAVVVDAVGEVTSEISSDRQADIQRQVTAEPAPPEETQLRVEGSSPQETPSASLPVRDQVRRISALGNDRLWFSFSDECWVEVLSTTGENLYSDLSRSGQTLELVGRGPFRILLGYAPGVRMAFNGEPVVLGPHTRNNVANLVLGQ